MADLKLKVSLEPNVDTGKLSAAVSAIKNADIPKLKVVDAEGTKTEIDKIKSELGRLTKAGEGGSEAAKQLREQLKTATAEAKKLADESAGIGKGLGAASGAGGALSGLVAKFKEGQAEASKGGGLFGSVAQSIGSMVNPAGLAVAAVGALSAGFAETINVGKVFEQGLAGLSAITGLTGEPLTDLGDRARSLAKQFGGDASTQVTAFQGVLSKFGAQLADTPEALGKVSENINILGKAGGLDAAQSMDTLANSMLQFGVNVEDGTVAAKESTRFINVLAASARVGAAEIPQVGQAVLVAGVAAKQAKLSFEETNAAIQVLAAGGKVGAEAGTALRNVLGKIAGEDVVPKETAAKLKKLGVDFGVLSDTTLPLSARLAELKKAQKDATAVAQLFGTENASAAAILIDGTAKIADWTEQITGTNDATEQAAKNMNTFGERMSRLKANFEDVFIGAFQKIGPALNSLLDNMGGIAKVVGVIGGAFAAYTIATNFSTIAIGINSLATVGWTTVTTLATAAFKALKLAMATNPFGLLVAGLTVAVGLYAAFHKSSADVANDQLAQAEAGKEALQAQIKTNEAQQTSQKSTKALVKEYETLAAKTSLSHKEQDRLRVITNQLDQQYPSLIDQTKSYKENLQGVEEIGRKTTESLQGLVTQNKQLQDQLAQSNINIAFAKRNVAIEDLKSAFGEIDSMWTHTAADEFKRSLILQNIYAVKTEEELNRVQGKLYEFINAHKDQIGNSKDFLAIQTAAQKLIEAQRTAMIGAGQIQKQNDEDANKSADEKAKKAAKAVKDKKTEFDHAQAAFATEKERLEAESKIAENRIKDNAASQNRQLNDKEQLQIKQNEYETQKKILAAAINLLKASGEGANITTAIKLDPKEKDSAQKEVVRTVSDLRAKVTDLKLGLVPSLNKADDKFFKDLEKSIKDQVSTLKGLISVDDLLKSTAGVTGIKAQIQDLLDTAKELQLSGQGELAADVIAQANALSEELNKNLRAAQIQRREIVLQSSADSAQKELDLKLLALEKEYQDAIDNAIKVGEKTDAITRNFEARRTAIIQAASQERTRIQIATLEQEGARSIAQQLVQLRTERDDLLNNVQATEEQKNAIKLRYSKQIEDILNGRDAETVRLKEDLKKQEAEIAKSFTKKELTYEEYIAKIKELRTKENEVSRRAADTKAAAIAVGLATDTKANTEAANKASDEFTAQLKKVFPQSFEEVGTAAIETLQASIAKGETDVASALTKFYTEGASTSGVVSKAWEGVTNTMSSATQNMAQDARQSFSQLEAGSATSFYQLGIIALGTFAGAGIAAKKSSVGIDATITTLSGTVADKFGKMASAIDTSFNNSSKSIIDSLSDVSTFAALTVGQTALAGENAANAVGKINTRLTKSFADAASKQQQRAEANLTFSLKSEEEKRAAISAAEKEKLELLSKSDDERTQAENDRLVALDKSLADMKDSTTAGFQAMGEASLLAFAGMVASGQNAMGSLKSILIENIGKVLQTYIAPIIASFLSFLGPFALPAALAAVSLVKGYFTSAIQGLRTGGKKTGGPQLIWINEEGDEFVHNARATRKNEAAFRWINNTGKTVVDYAVAHDPNIIKWKKHYEERSKFVDYAALPTIAEIKQHVSVNNKGVEERLDLQNEELKEMRKLLTSIMYGQRRSPGAQEIELQITPTRDYEARVARRKRQLARRGG